MVFFIYSWPPVSQTQSTSAYWTAQNLNLDLVVGLESQQLAWCFLIRGGLSTLSAYTTAFYPA